MDLEGSHEGCLGAPDPCLSPGVSPTPKSRGLDHLLECPDETQPFPHMSHKPETLPKLRTASRMCVFARAVSAHVERFQRV